MATTVTPVKEDIDSVKPGEVPSTEIVNVLEDILGVADNGGPEDELQKELDGTTSNTTPRARKSKGKATPKRKSARKSKTPAKAKSSAASSNATEPVVSTEVAKDLPIEEAPKKAAPVTESDNNQVKVVKTEEDLEQKDEKIESTENTDNLIKEDSKVNVKNLKKEKLAEPVQQSEQVKKEETVKPSKSKSTKKTKKSSTKKDTKKESATAKAALQKIKKEDSAVLDEEQKLTEQIKALEKIVTSQNLASATVKKSDSESVETSEKKKDLKKNSSPKVAPPQDRKRKSAETSAKESKNKKSSKTKVKVEKVEPKTVEEETTVLEVTQEVPDDEAEAMRIIDDVDGSQSDHGSAFSHGGSSFVSRTFSGSLSGSSFSDSLSLSSFTGSNASLEFSENEDIQEAEDEVKKKKRRKQDKKDEQVAEDIQNHKDFIDSLLKGARYFIVKSNNHENVTLSKAKGVWSTPPANERKLNDAYRHSTNVILIYSVKESGRFQGFARLASESRRDSDPVAWVLPPGFDPRILGATFKVDWLNRKEVPFAQCTNLRNPWNENKEVKICRDGQEVEPSVGEVLCRMFEDDLTVDLSRVARHLKQRKRLGDNFPKREHHTSSRFRGGYNRGGFRGEWRGGRGDTRGSFHHNRGGGSGGLSGLSDRYQQPYRGRFNARRNNNGYFRRGSNDFRGRSHFEDHHQSRHSNNYQQIQHHSQQNQHNQHDRFNRYNDRTRSRSPVDRRHFDRDSRDRRHKDKVKEFLKNERSKFGVRKETLLHGSYSDYVREFHKQKQYRGPTSSSYYSNYHHHSSGRSDAYDPTKAAAEEFLRRTSRR